MKNRLLKLRLLLCVVGAAWGALAPVGAWAGNDAEALYQEAMIKETGERDLEAAVVLYQRAIEQGGSFDPLLAAKARFRMGNCYERLGRTAQAEQAYQQILTDAANTPGEIAQMAQDSLRRLEAQKRKQQAAATVEFIRVYKETPARLSIGPAFLSTAEGLRTRLSIALRYPLAGTTSSRPASLFLELGALPPMGALKIQDRTEIPDTQTTDSGTLELHYQAHLSLVGELPHGRQRAMVPEIGVGVALTRAEIDYTSVVTGASPSTNSGRLTENNLGPYFSAGLHVYPDRVLSYRLQATYTTTPYPRSVNIATPAHGETFEFSNSLWGIAAELEVKIGWPKIIPKPK